MTRIEAENVIRNYKEYDEFGEECGYSIVEYKGQNRAGYHLFKCRADGTDTAIDELPTLAVISKNDIAFLPTNAS